MKEQLTTKEKLISMLCVLLAIIGASAVLGWSLSCAVGAHNAWHDSQHEATEHGNTD